MKKKVEKFPLWGQILYSSGGIGYSIADRIWITFLIYYILPPPQSGMPELMSNTTFLGVLTVTGAIIFFGRIVDAIADPLVATWSDRSKSKMGRRKFFLVFGGLPLMVSSALVFFLPTNYPSIANAVYLAVVLSILLFFFTFYVTPWLALIPELSHNNEERMNIVNMQAAFSLIGAIIVMIGGPILWGTIENAGVDKSTALKMTVTILAFIGLIFCYLAIIPIDEKRYCESVPSEVGMFESIKITFKNWPFIPYLLGTNATWFGFNIVSTGAMYYVTCLLLKEESFTSVALAAVFGVALICFVLIIFISRIIAKRTIVIAGSAILAIASVMLFFLGQDIIVFGFILHPSIQPYVLFGIIGIPVAILLAVPNAMISDLAEYDAIKTGSHREAMYFGAQGLLQKINLGFSALAFTYLLTLGTDVSEAAGGPLLGPMGVRISGLVVAFVCLLGMIFYIIYPEKKIMDVIEKHRAERNET